MNGMKRGEVFDCLSPQSTQIPGAYEEAVRHVDISFLRRHEKIVTKALIPAAAKVFISQDILITLSLMTGAFYCQSFLNHIYSA